MPVDHYRARENWERYIYARDGGHTDYVTKADKCERFFAGLQWEESIRRKLERQGKPVLTINETFASMASIMGEQLNNRSDISFRPKRDGRVEVADSLERLWLHFASHFKLDWTESEVAADGFITSRGFYDLRMSFNENMRGEAECTLWNPRNVIIDPDGEEYDPDKWKEAFLTKWFTVNEIVNTYGDEDVDELRALRKSNFDYGNDSIEYTGRERNSFDGDNGNWLRGDEDDEDPTRRRIRVIEHQYRELQRVPHFVDKVSGETRRVPTTWDRERIERVAAAADLGIIKRQTEVIRWLVTADTIVLHDEISPYKHLTVVPYFPYFRRGTTIGLVEHILSPQEMLNKTLSQELHVVNGTANAGYKVKKGALQNMDAEELEERGAETGLVIELDDIANIDKIQPNQIPTGLDRLSFKAQEFSKRVMNVPDTLRGFDREDVAAKAIAQKKVSSSNSFAKPLDNLNRTRHMLARNWVDLVQTYYTEQRAYQIMGRDLGSGVEEITVNGIDAETGAVVNDLTAGEYEAVVTTVPPRDTYQQQQFAEILQMRQLGIGIPDAFIVEASTLSRKNDIVKQLRGGDSSEAQQQLLALQQEITQLEMQSKKADILKKTADARLAEARAQSEIAEAGGDTGFDSELLIKREEMVRTLELKQQEIDNNLAMKQRELDMRAEQMEKEHDLKMATAEADHELRASETGGRLALEGQKSADASRLKSKEIDVKGEVAKKTVDIKAKATESEGKRKAAADKTNAKLKDKQISLSAKAKAKGAARGKAKKRA